MSRNISSKGIILGKRYFSDADAVIQIFTLDVGKISVVAKGIKRLQSKKRGNLETASLVQFLAYDSGKGLPLLREVASIENFNGIRLDLAKIYSAFFLLELTNKTSYEGEKNKALFLALKGMLKSLDKGRASHKRRLSFARKILSIQGFVDEKNFSGDVDVEIENVIERRLSTVRTAKKVFSP